MNLILFVIFADGDLSTMEKQLKRIFTETFKSIDEGFLAEARKSWVFIDWFLIDQYWR